MTLTQNFDKNHVSNQGQGISLQVGKVLHARAGMHHGLNV
jgi:hypothetical protein